MIAIIQILFIITLFKANFGFHDTLFSEDRALKDNNLYLYFDKNDKRQSKVENVNVPLRNKRNVNLVKKWYKADLFSYRYPLLLGQPIQFVTFPEKESFDIQLSELNQYNPLDVQQLIENIKSSSNLHKNQDALFFEKINKIYIVEIDLIKQKAMFTKVSLFFQFE